MPIPQVEIPEQRVVHQALENDVHVAGRPHVIYTPDPTGTAGCFCCVCRDESRVLLRGIGEQFVVLPFPGCEREGFSMLLERRRARRREQDCLASHTLPLTRKRTRPKLPHSQFLQCRIPDKVITHLAEQPTGSRFDV